MALALHVHSAMSGATFLSPDDPALGETLERNLAHFRRESPSIAERVANAALGDARVVVGPRGHAGVAWRETLLSSLYDPRADGVRLAAQVPEEADLVVTLGFGTGHHLEALRARAPRRLIVYEPDLSRLRAALCAAPQPVLGAREVHLATDETELAALLERWYVPGLSMSVLPHPSLARIAPEALRAAVDRIVQIKQLVDIRVATLRTWSQHWALTAAENAAQIVQRPRLGCLHHAFPGASAVVCAAGPSLGKQLPLLAERREGVLVLAIGQSVAALDRAGIRPDAVLVTETQDVAHQLESLPSLAEQTLILAPQAHPRLYELETRRGFVAFGLGHPFGSWMAKALGEPHLLRSGGSVAVSSVFLAAFLGATRIALIGQDLAFTDGRRYAEGTVYDALRVETEADGQVFFTNLKVKGDFFERPTPDREAAPGALWVEGWDGEPVLTDRSYASFLNEYESVARLLGEEGVRLENCTEGGARIPGLNHLPLADFLEAAPRRPLPADQRIEATRGAANPGDAAKLIREARDLEQATRALLKDARQGLERVARLEAAGPAGDTGALRRLQSAETKVRQQLERLPGIAAMMQHELHELSLASLRRGAADSGGPLARSRGLLEAAERSGEGLLELLRRLCQGVEENGLAEGDSAAGTG